jgi:quercetin dioxygenase-like cupin family protein
VATGRDLGERRKAVQGRMPDGERSTNLGDPHREEKAGPVPGPRGQSSNMDGASATSKALARHILEVAPKSARVVFENDLVRVIEVTMRKGQSIPMHSHNKGLSYSLNGGKIKSTRKDGKSVVFKVRKGELSWSDADGVETHAVDNLGGVLRELSVEIKG